MEEFDLSTEAKLTLVSGSQILQLAKVIYLLQKKVNDILVIPGMMPEKIQTIVSADGNIQIFI